ncbi:MAG TPA: ferredoxin--NADP reductase [Polyangiaceae bacterium]|nr:ferredoxin--NADP reductase [Polyangiaceae bacterium]
MSAWTRAEIQFRHQWTEDLITLGLAAEIEPFEAGQWVNLGCEMDGELVRRPYSLASAPGAPPEFFLTRVPEGVLTPSLFDLPIGASLQMERQPQGFFTLKYVPEARDLWLVATGTGLGPFISMLRSKELWQRFERVVVVHGVRFERQLGYREELAKRAAASAGQLTVVPLVSRDPDAAGLLQGRVTTTFADGRLEQAAGIELSPERSHLMLCGNPEMIGEMTAALEARGLHRHRQRRPGHYSIEKYW